jgi:hypothetical protein
MKKLATLAIAMGLVASSYAQGYFNFNNTAGGPVALIGAQGAAGEGSIGAVIGSDGSFATPNYDVAFLYAFGTYGTMAAFNAASPVFGVQTSMFGPTGGSPSLDGSGIFDSGATTITPSADGTMITVLVEAWYDPTGTATFAQAQALGHNTGVSALQSVRLAAGNDLLIADLGGMATFEVNGVPEPSTLALAGIGAALLIIRRRK